MKDKGRGFSGTWVPEDLKATGPGGKSDLVNAAGRTQPLAAVMPLPSAELANNNTEMDESKHFQDNYKLPADEHFKLGVLTCTPIIIIVGTIGNIWSTLIFKKLKKRLPSVSCYLTALATSETLFLWLLIPSWLEEVGASNLFAQLGYCKLTSYASYFVSMTSSWLVVSFTLDRLVAEIYPLRRKSLCTMRCARTSSAAISAGALLINLPVLWFPVTNCDYEETTMYKIKWFNLYNIVGAFMIPLAIITVSGFCILTRVHRLKRSRGLLLRQQRQEYLRPLVPGYSSASNNGYQFPRRATTMLLIVSALFVLLDLPIFLTRIIASIRNMHENKYSDMWAAVQQICFLLYRAKFAVNIFLYLSISKTFHLVLYETVPCLHNHTNVIAMQNITCRTTRVFSISTSYARAVNNDEALNNGDNSSGVSRARQAGTGLPGTPRREASRASKLQGNYN